MTLELIPQQVVFLGRSVPPRHPYANRKEYDNNIKSIRHVAQYLDEYQLLVPECSATNNADSPKRYNDCLQFIGHNCCVPPQPTDKPYVMSRGPCIYWLLYYQLLAIFFTAHRLSSGVEG